MNMKYIILGLALHYAVTASSAMEEKEADRTPLTTKTSTTSSAKPTPLSQDFENILAILDGRICFAQQIGVCLSGTPKMQNAVLKLYNIHNNKNLEVLNRFNDIDIAKLQRLKDIFIEAKLSAIPKKQQTIDRLSRYLKITYEEEETASKQCQNYHLIENDFYDTKTYKQIVDILENHISLEEKILQNYRSGPVIDFEQIEEDIRILIKEIQNLVESKKNLPQDLLQEISALHPKNWTVK